MSKHHIRYYITLLCLLIILSNTDAQINTKVYRNSIFNKYAVNPVHQLKEKRPYYIIAWDSAIPQNIKIIRQLDERTAIIELKRQQAFDLLKQVRIAEAADA